MKKLFMSVALLLLVVTSFAQTPGYEFTTVSTHCMALVYPISQLYLCTELKILFLWTLLIVF